ncbi:GDP-L-fucose synthase family protein [Desulfurobacterium thermolithotrophum]|uniref:GDP-L-fucose synthase family protein n=1 Tax=Desulfurobacterium thermolithotrophum TaxID=64160 RepID=UPI0013CFE66B|nr:GDP-L-fucose synthase [Desulfurobacterium thermolithotrophum]
MNKNSKIYVAGGTGLVGSAIIRKLLEKGYSNIVSTYHSRKPQVNGSENIRWVKVDLTDQNQVKEFFTKEKPEYVFLAAAKVGGILANNIYRAEFIYQNLQIQNNVIHQSYLNGVKKLLFLGSTCIYPRNCHQPIKEEYLLTGELEYTNEPYAIAKIAGMKMCESYNLQYGTNFIAVMPTNLYGYNDNFDLEKSHVLPALLRKIYLAKALEEDNWEEIRRDLSKLPIEGVTGEDSKEEILGILEKYGIKSVTRHSLPVTQVEVWGTGKPKREFLWSEDMADACVFLMENIDFWDIVKLIKPELPDIRNTSCLPISFVMEGKEIRNTHLNIGTGEDISIKDLAYLIKDIVGFKGEIYFNTSKPDGTPRKVTDVSRLHSLGWRHKVSLEEGIKKLYEWYVRREW